MKFKAKKLLYVGLILLTLCIVLFIGIRSGDFPASIRAILAIPLPYVLVSVLCTFGGILMQTLSCRSALKKLGHTMSFGQLYAIMVLGEFYSYITPGASGGQPMQVYQFHRCRQPVGDATSALTIHFHCFQLTLLIFDVILYAVYRDFINAQIGPNLPFLIIGFVFNIVLISLSLMIAFYQRPVRFLVDKVTALMRRFKVGDPDKLLASASGVADGFYEGMHRLATDWREIARQFAFAIVRLMLLMSVMYFIYHGLGQSSASYGKIITMGCMQYTSAAYTPLPGASGAQEGVFSLYYASLLPDSLLLSGLLCWRFITYYLVLIVGFFVTTALGMANKDVDEVQAEVIEEFREELEQGPDD